MLEENIVVIVPPASVSRNAKVGFFSSETLGCW